jgi:hypothetical protein
VSRRATPWLFALAGVLSTTLVEVGDPLSPQSVGNRAFAEAGDYATALAELGHVWPPLYPSLLFCADAVGVSPHAFGLLLFGASIALLFPLGRRIAPGVHPGWWAGLYALAEVHAANLRQLSSEVLLIPLALGVLWASLVCAERGRVRDYSLLTLLLGASCFTRYFAVFWLVPVVFLVLAWCAPGAPLPRLARAALASAVALLPVSVWMFTAWLTTGFLTGMDRAAPRALAAWTTFDLNLTLTARTVLLDWFVPGRSASHAALIKGWVFEPLIAASAALTVALASACLAAAWRGGRRALASEPAAGWLLMGLSLGYGFWLIALWTVGNNDPIYTRFVYPAYVFVGLAMFHFYSRVKAQGTARLRQPFRMLYAWALAIQVVGLALAITGRAST